MVLAAFLSSRAQQKHASAAECQRSTGQTRGKVFTQAFSPEPALTALRILPRTAGKLTGSAKVRLTPYLLDLVGALRDGVREHSVQPEQRQQQSEQSECSHHS